ncbi:MAG: SSI family serine proteinase inhibitor [Gaiellaceae bacterium]
MRIALLSATLIAAVGCGAGQGASGSTPGTNLAISIWPEGRGTGVPTKWTLRCDPAGGTLPRRAAACRQLYGLTRPFAPPRKDLACTDLYGGPQQAVISGMYRGSRISTVLGMRNGCEISRAEKLAFLVPGFASAAGS